MAIYVDGRTTRSTPDGADINFPSASLGSGHMFVFCQSSAIGGYDVPPAEPGFPGWQVAAGSGGVDNIFWGIQGVHFPDNDSFNGPTFTGGSAGIAIIITRLEIVGNIDETSYVEGVFDSFLPGAPPQGYFTVTPQLAVDRGRESVSIALMTQHYNSSDPNPPWADFQGGHALLNSPLYVNQRVNGTAGNYAGCSQGLAYAEDNADITQWLGGNRFFPELIPDPSARADGANAIVYGGAPKPLGVIAPALVF